MKIVKSTSKGQITLPIQWRSQFNSDNYILEIGEKQIIIKPLQIDKKEEIIFDADRDNEGKGIPIDDMIKMLKKIKHE